MQALPVVVSVINGRIIKLLLLGINLLLPYLHLE